MKERHTFLRPAMCNSLTMPARDSESCRTPTSVSGRASPFPTVAIRCPIPLRSRRLHRKRGLSVLLRRNVGAQRTAEPSAATG